MIIINDTNGIRILIVTPCLCEMSAHSLTCYFFWQSRERKISFDFLWLGYRKQTNLAAVDENEFNHAHRFSSDLCHLLQHIVVLKRFGVALPLSNALQATFLVGAVIHHECCPLLQNHSYFKKTVVCLLAINAPFRPAISIFIRRFRSNVFIFRLYVTRAATSRHVYLIYCGVAIFSRYNAASIADRASTLLRRLHLAIFRHSFQICPGGTNKPVTFRPLPQRTGIVEFPQGLAIRGNGCWPGGTVNEPPPHSFLRLTASGARFNARLHTRNL